MIGSLQVEGSREAWLCASELVYPLFPCPELSVLMWQAGMAFCEPLGP